MLKYLYQQRPVTAPAVMTMEEYKTHMTQKLHPPSQISKTSSLASVEDSNKDSKTPVNKPNINVEDASESSRPQAEEVKPSVKNIAEDLEEQTEATDKADDESSESCAVSERVETPVSDKMKLMNLMKEESPITDSARRVKSAIVPRIHRAQDRDNGFENGEDCQPRSQSAFGGSRVDQAIEDIAPMPYMEHSKPKFVSVGSIGKVSLLESITEAKYWEDLAMEQQHAKKQKQLETIKGNDIVEDMRKHETELVANNDINEEKNGEDQPTDKELDVRNEIFDSEVFDDFEFMDGRSSSQSKKHRKKNKKSLVNDLDIDDEEDVLAMILAEEKRRRKLQKASGKKHSFNFCSSARTSKSNSPISTSRSRLGSSTSYTSKSSSENKKAEDEKQENKETADVENNDKPQYRSALKSPEKALKGGPEKRVIVRTVSELQEENKRAPSKYDRLIKRLGDNMTPYLKSQMLKVS